MKRLSLALAGLLAPALASAQLPDPSTRALGMAGAYASLARGYEAVAWNPALLAAWGRPGVSVGLPQASLELGSNAYGFSDLRTYANSFLTDSIKQQLFDKIPAGDATLTIRTLVGVAPFGLSVGPAALAIGAAGELDLSAGRDVVDLALFGNARRAVLDQDYADHASGGRAWAATTGAASFALPFPVPLGRLSVGVTGKLVLANFLLSARDVATTVGTTPTFHASSLTDALYTDTTSACSLAARPSPGGGSGGGFSDCSKWKRVGSGFGADLGATLQLARSGITLSAVLVNALASMSWDQDQLTYERTERTITQAPSGQVTDTVTARVLLRGSSAISSDPAASALRDSVLAQARFARLARLGFAMRRGSLWVSGDLQVRLAEGLDRQPAQLVAGGAEYRALGFLPLRAGAAWDFGKSLTLAAGVGLEVAGVNLDFSLADISGTGRPGVRIGAGMGLIF